MHARLLLLATALIALTACGDEVIQPAVEPRPVRVVTIEKLEQSSSPALAGRIEAASEASLGFRIGGRVLERPVSVGDRVEAGQVLARLEPQNETNALRAAKAAYAAANAALVEARNRFERQATLLEQGWTTRALYDQAEKAHASAEAQLDKAEAQLKSAKDLLSFTELKADAAGVVVATGADTNEVVQAGEMVVRLAREGGRDAVFDVPAQLLRTAPADPEVSVHLTDDPTVTATGRVREVGAQADPVTRTFQVKVGLSNPPEAMRLGASVTGRFSSEAGATIEIPAAALTRAFGEPSVWVVDQKNMTVSPRTIQVQRFDPAAVAVSEGLDIGDVVVTAGVQALHPGQRVRILGSKL
jgi:membrane fusion protein, multidrug efflux system